MEVTGPLSRHSWGEMRDESQHHLRGRLRVNRIQNVTIFHLRFLGFPLNCKSPLQKLTIQITPKLINYNYYFKAMNFYCGSANYLPASESQCEPCESSLEPFLRIFFFQMVQCLGGRGSFSGGLSLNYHGKSINGTTSLPGYSLYP